VTTPLPVTAVHASPFRFIAYANARAGALLHDRGLVNRVSVVPADGRSADDVKRDLLRLPSVAAVQGAAAMTDAVDQRMTQFTDVLLITVTVAVLMALLIAYNSTSINADERARENATMLAYGVGSSRVTIGTMLEALITGALGTLVGVAAGYGLLRWIIEVNMPATMPDVGTLVAIRPFTYVLAAVTGIAIVGLTPLLAVHRLRRTDIPSTLRVVE
jgi:putative ABC transport system permease protein